MPSGRYGICRLDSDIVLKMAFFDSKFFKKYPRYCNVLSLGGSTVASLRYACWPTLRLLWRHTAATPFSGGGQSRIGVGFRMSSRIVTGYLVITSTRISALIFRASNVETSHFASVAPYSMAFRIPYREYKVYGTLLVAHNYYYLQMNT